MSIWTDTDRDSSGIDVDREKKRTQRPYLVSALVEAPDVSGHRAELLFASSEEESLGSFVLRMQRDEPTVSIRSIEATPISKQFVARIKALDISLWED